MVLFYQGWVAWCCNEIETSALNHSCGLDQEPFKGLNEMLHSLDV
jgi:hypothetical protein